MKQEEKIELYGHAFITSHLSRDSSIKTNLLIETALKDPIENNILQLLDKSRINGT
jgi:hypothetical protein